MKYEMMVILNPKQTDQEIEKQLGEVKEAVAENGFKIVDEDNWGSRKLAYKIKGLTEGYYVVMLFEGEAQGSVQLHKDLRLINSVVRYMMMKVEDDYTIMHYDSSPKDVAPKQKLSAHAEELNKKMKKKDDAPKKAEKVEEKKEEEKAETEEEPKELDEKLQAIIDDTDIEL
jgi:small subunit ribosomal protein S6